MSAEDEDLDRTRNSLNAAASGAHVAFESLPGEPEAVLIELRDDGTRTPLPFHGTLHIGRLKVGSRPKPGSLYIHDATVSSRHCTITRLDDGQTVIRDTSTNGTRLDNRRLTPNIETPLRHGAIIRIANQRFVFEALDDTGDREVRPEGPATVVRANDFQVTVLVGDIQDYTVLVRSLPAEALTGNLSRVFRRLEQIVISGQGAVKEYQGDAIFCYWDQSAPGEYEHVNRACEAALELHRAAREMASDPGIWDLELPLRIDWALASGSVRIATMGEAMKTGLHMIGEPVVRAFRIEKHANEDTGPIVACPETRLHAGDAFQFRPLGAHLSKGFDEPDEIFALLGRSALP